MMLVIIISITIRKYIAKTRLFLPKTPKMSYLVPFQMLEIIYILKLLLLLLLII